jgi:hypothetical protein
MSAPEELDLREVNERRSIALHRLVGERLVANPELVDAARQRVNQWMADASIHHAYGEAWRQLLTGPAELLLAALVDPGEHARTLRQCSPFAGVLDPKTRWRVWREAGGPA